MFDKGSEVNWKSPPKMYYPQQSGWAERAFDRTQLSSCSLTQSEYFKKIWRNSDTQETTINTISLILPKHTINTVNRTWQYKTRWEIIFMLTSWNPWFEIALFTNRFLLSLKPTCCPTRLFIRSYKYFLYFWYHLEFYTRYKVGKNPKFIDERYTSTTFDRHGRQKQNLRMRARCFMGYGIKIFSPVLRNDVTRSPETACSSKILLDSA